ncbi:hypothetical protein QN363_20515, partial [Undibacterium sp. CCC2.1]
DVAGAANSTLGNVTIGSVTSNTTVEGTSALTAGQQVIILGIPVNIAAGSSLTGNNGISVTSGGDATIAGALSGGAGTASLNAAG